MTVSILTILNVHSAGKHQDTGGQCASGLTTRGYKSFGGSNFQLLVKVDYDMTITVGGRWSIRFEAVTMRPL
jgi:hypothetical protein